MIKTISTLALALAAALLPATAGALGKSALPQVQERYRTERAACLNGQSHQSLQTCLREAEAARAQALRADLDDGVADYARNASRRCDRLPTELRQDCAARMAGAGTVSGSVATGGIYRELVTAEPAKADKPPIGR
jgi:hypothetical protein